MPNDLWKKCLNHLKQDQDIAPKDYNTWIRPLQAHVNDNCVRLQAPNQFVLTQAKENYFKQIVDALTQLSPTKLNQITFEIGSERASDETTQCFDEVEFQSNLNTAFTFETFVVGRSNNFARAAALQVAENPTGNTYNPLFIHGGVGLGKTHLMHAIGNEILKRRPNAKVLYSHSEGFVAGMVRALQHNKMEEFKDAYRSVDALLVDDIQFFAGKERSQEEFFHTFNALLDANQQIVITCDKYPKEIKRLEERLKSRFGWGLTVSVEPPDLETRVAILMSKAEQSQATIPNEVAFFIAKRIQSNVRELEGALKRVIANAHFTGQDITLDFAHEALKDLLAVQAKLVSIESIQKTIAEYYKIKLTDLLSKRRSRFLVRARQIAMVLSKELTNHSLPEIGEAFGGRDHTTVIHGCRKMKELMESDQSLHEDYMSLLRILST